MDVQKHIKYWLKAAEHDLKAAEGLFELKHYDYCLYIAHLVLEKSLKAFYVKDKKQIPPKTHDLVKLIESTALKYDEETEKFLSQVTDFNIEAKYPDFKFSFYKTCTKEFTEYNFNKIKEYYKWLKSQIK